MDVIRSRVNETLVHVLRRLDRLGLSVAAEKTEAVLFCGNVRPDVNPVVRVGRTFVRMSPRLKYLGLMLDARLNFSAHFSYVEEKMTKITRALCCLMPNLRGRSERKRRLYANVLGSMALYGAPIWSDSLASSPSGKRTFRHFQRVIELRVCSAYRTVSFAAATLMARIPPWDLVAAERKRVFTRLQDSRALVLSRWRMFANCDQKNGPDTCPRMARKTARSGLGRKKNR